MMTMYDTHIHKQRSYTPMNENPDIPPEVELQHAIYAQAVEDLITGLCSHDAHLVLETKKFLCSGSYEMDVKLGEYLCERAEAEYHDAVSVIRRFAWGTKLYNIVDPNKHSPKIIKVLIRTQFWKKLSFAKDYNSGLYILKYRKGVHSLGKKAEVV